MQNTFNALFITHATAGSLMLLSGMVALVVKKGHNSHRVSGKVYAASTALVGITGFIIAVNKSNQFLIATSLFVLYMMVSAYRSLYLKQLYKVVKVAPVDWLIIACSSVAAVYLLAIGGIGIAHSNNGAIVPLVFGGLCMRFNIRDIMKFVKGPADKKHWLYNHIIGMVGSYIAGVTAFLAVNAGYFTNDFVIWLWLAPTVLGTPYIVYTIMRYKKPKAAQKELPLKIRVPQDR